MFIIVDFTCFSGKSGQKKKFLVLVKSKTICVLYFRFVPSPEIFSPAPIFPEGQSKWERQYDIGERLKLEGEMENIGVCTKERKGMTAEVLMATPCTKSLCKQRTGR